MKTINVSEEVYNHLQALGVKMEEQSTNDLHEGFVVGKKYRHKAGHEAYYCGKNKYDIPFFEFIDYNGVTLTKGIGIPEVWESKGNNTYWGILNDFDPTPIEEAKELNPWEKYPTLESCWENKEVKHNVSTSGELIIHSIGHYGYSTEAEARKAKATIFLSRIARKWNEGVSIKDDRPWFITKRRQASWSAMESNYTESLPFYFHSKELAEKSLELFPEVWNDFYGRG